MSEATDERAGSVAAFDADAATGVVVGTAIPVVQYVLWQLVVDGPFTGSGVASLRAEMALFFAIGVVVPAGGIAALYEDSPLAGTVGTVTYLLVGLVVASTFGLPEWVLGAIPWVVVVLVIAAALGRYRADRE